MNPTQAWQAVLGQLQIEMAKATFDTWVRDTALIAYEDGLFIIGVQNAYARDWLDNRLTTTVVRLLNGIMGRTVEVRFAVWQDNGHNADVNVAPETEADQLPISSSPKRSPFNPRYTFNAFVVGAGNRLAHAASLAVAENPARSYNPLFLYGGVGLGKTTCCMPLVIPYNWLMGRPFYMSPLRNSPTT